MMNDDGSSFGLNEKFAMKVSEIPGLFKVADVIPHNEWNRMVKFDFCVGTEIQKSPRARLYVLASDKEVIKIGGSADKGGIKGTLKWYQDGFAGNPDDKGRTLGVPTALLAEIQAGREVEVYMIFAPTFTFEVPGIVANAEMEVSGYKQMETLWVEQFITINDGHAPILNMQESGQRHPPQMLSAIEYYYSLLRMGATPSGRGKGKRAFTPDEQNNLIRLVEAAVVAYSELFESSNIDVETKTKSHDSILVTF